MENKFINNLKEATNFDFTENHAVKHVTTHSNVLDMFSLCGSYRNRSDEDCIRAFSLALAEDKALAMKCLFYLRDCRGGQGERRFFRVCYNWLCCYHLDLARNNMACVPEFGRWDDLIYSAYQTPLWKVAADSIKYRLELDAESDTPTLLAKWMPSENVSSAKTRGVARALIKEFGWTAKQYRKTLSALRKKINILETIMSEGRWDEIEFDKIPSVAGMKYREAFIRHDVKKEYEKFMKDKNTKVNADVLNPVDIANKVLRWGAKFNELETATLQKYWDNLKDYYNGREENGLCMVDVSGSMTGTPMSAAVSMGAYIAERGHGPFANHFITFSGRPQLVEFKGNNIIEKMQFCEKAEWGMNTNLEAAMDLVLDTLIDNKSPQSDVPDRFYIFSDMEFDCGIGLYGLNDASKSNKKATLFENIEKKWRDAGYEMPQVIFWNLDARTQNVPALGDKFSYISGFSMNMIEAILSGKTGYDLMLEKLSSERYSIISVAD